MDGKGGITMCKLKGRMDKGGHYDVEMTGLMQKSGIIRGKLKGGMDKAVHYYVEMKGWFKRGHYHVQFKRGDGSERTL